MTFITHTPPPHATRNIAQKTRPAFHFLEESGYKSGIELEAGTISTATPVFLHTREEGCLLRELLKTKLHLVESLVKPLMINSSKK